MRYLVAVKQVPDTMDAPLNEDGSIARSKAGSMMNPYCEYALRRTLSMRREGDSVEVFTMGPPSADRMLRRCLELGADKAYHLCDGSFAGSDVRATARVVASFISKYADDASLIVFGRSSVDGCTGQLPFEVAAMLGRQQFAYAVDVEPSEEGFIVSQDYEDARRVCVAPYGSVVSFADVDPYGCLPSLEGFRSALGKDIVKVDRVAVGLGFYSVGLNGSPTKIIRTEGCKAVRRNRKVEIRNPSSAADILMNELEGI